MTFLSGEKNLFITFLTFFVFGFLFYSFIIFFIIYNLLNFYPFAICSMECARASDISIYFNLTYYLVNIFVITTSCYIMISSYILWLNSKNTYNINSLYSSRIFSIGIGFSSFVFFLFGVWYILIPENHLSRIIPSLMFNRDGISFFWNFFITNK